jgi:multisubunit Na+/H+ antiporter MnhG subunit
MLRRVAGLLTFGAIGGTLLDLLHFGGLLYALGYRRLRGARAAPGWGVALAALGVFAILYAASAFLPASNVVKLVVLAAGAIVLWAWIDRSWQGVVLAAIAAVTGPLTEAALSRAGLFRHLQADVLGVPIWLPALYAASGPSFGQLARRALRGS